MDGRSSCAGRCQGRVAYIVCRTQREKQTLFLSSAVSLSLSQSFVLAT